MSRLVIVSNRVPSPENGQCEGGLAVALSAALKDKGGLWFGWSGRIAEAKQSLTTTKNVSGFELAAIDLSREEFRAYYEQAANRVLWPLFHGRLDLTCFDQNSFELYQEVNRRFAHTLRTLLNHDDIIWVHDYHLIPLGAELRRLGVTAPIGFFLHIPFPPLETLAVLPRYRALLEDLRAYDVVGLQTTNCQRNLRVAMKRCLSGKFGTGRSSLPKRPVNYGHYPIGIETDAFATLASSPQVRGWCDRFRASMHDQTWAIGVDRLDYTKGLPERFAAFETLFDRSSDLRGRVSLVQIAAPSRVTLSEYQDLRGRLEAFAGRINGRLGQLDWTPIHYLNRAFDHTKLAALYRVSRIGVVTPLRDGMNLVAKEYVAAQDPKDPGVLVLSRFAGAAEELPDALLVNPYDAIDVAETLEAALHMSTEDRQERWQRMMSHLMRNDVHRWCRNFLDDLVSTRSSSSATTILPRVSNVLKPEAPPSDHPPGHRKVEVGSAT